jgi:hypothetical protein
MTMRLNLRGAPRVVVLELEDGGVEQEGLAIGHDVLVDRPPDRRRRIGHHRGGRLGDRGDQIAIAWP